MLEKYHYFLLLLLTLIANLLTEAKIIKIINITYNSINIILIETN